MTNINRRRILNKKETWKNEEDLKAKDEPKLKNCYQKNQKRNKYRE